MTTSGTWAPTVLTVLLAGVLVVALLGAGIAKLAGVSAMRQSAAHLGFSWPAYRSIGALEVAGALGVLGGVLRPRPLLGALAAGCLALLLVLAAATHLRRGDRLPAAAPAAVLAVLALAVTGLLVLGA